MYSGVGRINSSNVNSNSPVVESGVEIPEWKRLLIMRKRAGALAATTTVTSDETNAKTAVTAEPVCSHFRNPVPSGRYGNLSGNCNVITGCSDGDLPPGSHTHCKFSPMLRSPASTSLSTIENDRSNSDTAVQDTVIRTIGNITVELRTVHNRVAVVENGIDGGDVLSSTPDRFPLMSPSSSSEPVYLGEEDIDNEEAEETTEDLQYGPGIVDKLRARFLNLGRKSRRRPVVRKFSSLENLSPGGYGTIRAIGPHNKSLKGEYRRSGIRATNLNSHHGPGSNFKKAQSMETLLMGSTSPSPGSTPDSNFGLRRGRLFVKTLSPGYTTKYPEVTTIPSPRSFQEAKKRFEYSRQVSGSNINEDELPKPDTVKQVKKIFESPSTTTVHSNDSRSCHPIVNQHSNEKQNGQLRTTVLGTPPSSTPKPPPMINAIAVAGNLRPRKVSPANTTVNTTSSIILEEDFIVSANDNSAKPPNDVEQPQIPVLTNGLLDASEKNFSSDENDHIRFSELINDSSLICKSGDGRASLSSSDTCKQTSSEREDIIESSAKLNNIVVDSSFLPEQATPTNGGVTYQDSAKVTAVCAERLPLIEQNKDYSSGEKKGEPSSSQGSQVSTEPEQEYRVTSVTRRKPHPHQPDSPTTDGSVIHSPVSEEDDSYDEVCEDDQEDDIMVVASSSQDDAPSSHLRTRDSHAAVAPQSHTNNILNFSKKSPSNWQKPPQTTTSVVFDFRGKDVKPNISLNPTPFGCKPAKVKKRAGSPPRGDGKVVNGGVPSVDPLGLDDEEEDEEDWDEMDIGADLPAASGITFDGENVKVGKGALLEIRNKKLTIQFDDQATSTYEYPCESPIEDYATDETTSTAIKSSSAIGSYVANSSLSSYMPHVLSSSEDFQLGVSRAPMHRPPPPLPTRSESPVTTSEIVVPADPNDSAGWSSADTSDILF